MVDMSKTRTYDAARYLETPEDIAYYLEAVLEMGDPKLLTVALGDVARSKGMSELAARTGLQRESLYRSLGKKGNPRLDTLFAVCKSLGVRLSMVPLTPGVT